MLWSKQNIATPCSLMIAERPEPTLRRDVKTIHAADNILSTLRKCPKYAAVNPAGPASGHHATLVPLSEMTRKRALCLSERKTNVRRAPHLL
jgi:hypothetical protein